MAKVKNPARFTTAFGIDSEVFKKTGAFDPVLNMDTLLFINPLLLQQSTSIEMQSAKTLVVGHFSSIIKLLRASKTVGDTAWRAASNLMTYPEVQGTCLGYGAGGISGASFGRVLQQRIVATAKEIIDLGEDDTDLFLLLPLLENDVGPDLISDMITNIIVQNLSEYTQRIVKPFKIPLADFSIHGQNVFFPVSPILAGRGAKKKSMPVILTPQDILSDLPVADDWDDVASAAQKSKQLRKALNLYIGDIWSKQSRDNKAELRKRALASRDAVVTLIEAVRSIGSKPYDADSDPAGVLRWKELLESVALNYPKEILPPKEQTIEEMWRVVHAIVEQFRFLIENRDYLTLLWRDTGTPQREFVSQRIFFAIADTYCKANNIDISPEADTGTGKVDFKFSNGYECKIVVEIKLSRNPNLIDGYTEQLESYKHAETTFHGLYLVVEVTNIKYKKEQLEKIKEKMSATQAVSDIVYINAKNRPSASKRKSS